MVFVASFEHFMTFRRTVTDEATDVTFLTTSDTASGFTPLGDAAPGPNLTRVGTSPLMEWGRPTSPLQRTNGDGSRWRFSAGGATCRRTAAASA